jgi:poly-gamma-glutamate synthesis protein (capsule biosynthesis protein)
LGRHDQHRSPRRDEHRDTYEQRRRILRWFIWSVAIVAVLFGANAAAGAWIRTGTRPTLEPAPKHHTPAPSPSPARPSATKNTAAAKITLAFTGDMLASDEMLTEAKQNAGGAGYNFGPMLATVAPILSKADWAICHQETPVSDNDQGVSGYPTFNAPFELAAAERQAGYDACDTASNHTADLGDGGITATLGTLDKYGIRHTGSARTQAEAAQPTIYDVKGVKVGHLAYTFGLNNGTSVSQPWMVNIIDIGKIKAEAHKLKQDGANIVVVSVHDGTEQQTTPSSDQLRIDDELMQSPDIDLIVGAHAHVVQPIKRLPDGRWIVYGVGNFLAQQSDGVTAADPNPPNRDGVIVEPTFTRQSDGHYTITQMGYVPTFVDAPSDVVELAPAFSRQRTVASLSAMGAPLVDLTPH